MNSLLLRGLGHQGRVWLLSFVLLMIQLSLQVLVSRENITKAAMELKQVITEYGLTISFPKIKLLVVGTVTTDNDLAPLALVAALLNQYHPSDIWGCLFEGHGGVALDLNDKIAGASKVLEFLESLLSGRLLVK